jgi:hypothetical protein
MDADNPYYYCKNIHNNVRCIICYFDFADNHAVYCPLYRIGKMFDEKLSHMQLLNIPELYYGSRPRCHIIMPY